MPRRLVPLLAALALLATPPAFAADDPPGDLKFIPPDAAVFVHLDVAALYDSKCGETLKANKSGEVILNLAPASKHTGLTIADVKTVQFSYPSMQDQSSQFKYVTVVSFRKKYDREKVVAALKKSATGSKTEFSEKGHVVKITGPSPFSPDNKLTTTHDLTDDTRIVSLTGLGDEYLKASEVKGIHTAALKANGTAAVLMGMNFNVLPEEIRGDNLPPEFRPFRPIFLADGMTAVGTIANDKLNLTMGVKAKTKADALEVEKALDALRGLADASITASKKSLKDNFDKPQELGKLLDAVQTALKDTKFSVADSITSLAMSMPLDAPFGPFLELLGGGGASARAQSTNNVKQLALSMHNYDSAHNSLPTPATLGKKGKKLLSWRVEILPYVGEDALYKQFKHDEPWDSEHNLKVFKDNPMPKVFAIPATTNLDDKKTHYQVFVGNGAMFEPTGPTKFTDILDGSSNTFMVVTAAKAVEWTKPDDIEFDPKADVANLLLFKDGVCVIGFGDGSVRAISEKVSEKMLKAMITRNGGEVVNENDD